MSGGDVGAVQALLTDAFDRVRDLVRPVNDDRPAVLAFRPAPHANTIAWLVWHLTRVQDTHIAHLAGAQDVWRAAEWVERFDLGLDADDTGYGAGPVGVAALDHTPGSLLVGYHSDVHAATLAYVGTLDEAELERVVDRSWDPPVTTSVRLVSVLGDCLQHLGQAAYLRGLATDR